FYESATIQVNHYGPAFVRRFCRGPDVQVETILADRTLLHERLGPGKPRVILNLKTGIAKMIDFADACPACARLGSPPSQIINGWSGEGYTLIGGHALRIGDAGNGTVLCANHIRFHS